MPGVAQGTLERRKRQQTMCTASALGSPDPETNTFLQMSLPHHSHPAHSPRKGIKGLIQSVSLLELACVVDLSQGQGSLSPPPYSGPSQLPASPSPDPRGRTEVLQLSRMLPTVGRSPAPTLTVCPCLAVGSWDPGEAVSRAPPWAHVSPANATGTSPVYRWKAESTMGFGNSNSDTGPSA